MIHKYDNYRLKKVVQFETQLNTGHFDSTKFTKMAAVIMLHNQSICHVFQGSAQLNLSKTEVSLSYSKHILCILSPVLVFM
jgi:hypothetical protein